MNPVYRPDIDGLRALAVLSVMLYHLAPKYLPGGFIGVDVFFVISGYVVTSSLVSSNSSSFTGFVGAFYARRLARILPALVLVLLVSAYLSTLFIPFAWLSGFSEKTALAAFFGISNWVMQTNADTYFAPRAEFNPYTHSWSLGVEEQFYLLVPALIYFWLVSHRSKRKKLAKASSFCLTLLCVLSLIAAMMASKRQPEVAFYSIICRFWELGTGVLLFLHTSQSTASQTRPTWLQFIQNASPWVGLSGIVASMYLADPVDFPWPWALPAIAGTGLILASQKWNQNSPLHVMLSQALPLWIGKRSYSLYLWHWPIYVLLRWTVGLDNVRWKLAAIALTFFFAATAYRLVETPLRHMRWLERRHLALRITVFALLPVLGFWGTQNLFNNRNRFSLSEVSKNAAEWYTGDRMVYADLEKRFCRADVAISEFAGGLEYTYTAHSCKGESRKNTLFVLGDSHARAYHPMFEQLSADTGMTVRIYEFAGCSYVNFIAPMELGSRGCLAFAKSTLDKSLQSYAAGDLVFLPSLRYMRYGDQWASFHISDMAQAMYSNENMKNREAAFQDAGQWIKPLIEKGFQIAFEAPKPIFKAPAFRCADWFNEMNPICEGRNKQDRQLLEQLRAPILESMDHFRASSPIVRIWDPFPILCPDAICHTSREGHPLFFDGDHPSAYSNLLLYPSFKNFILAQ